MTTKIPTEVLTIYNKIIDAGYEAYLVGGSVRSLLLGQEPKDWDFTTNATPEEILKLFPDGFYDNQFGTVGVPITVSHSGLATTTIESSNNGDAIASLQHDKSVIEITTYRTEHGYSDKRRPDKVSWGKTIEEDLSRRDFTINAIALSLNNGIPRHSGKSEPSEDASRISNHDKRSWTSQDDEEFEIVDPFNGQKDLEQKIIRAVGDPDERFKEDALRLMRAVRIATQLSFTIEDKTWQAIQQDAPLIQHIAHERIKDELFKILASDYPYDGIMLLKNAGLLQYILPELMEGIDVSQVRPGRHHTTDVFTHNAMSLKHCPATDPLVRFATLIHDVAKPRVRSEDANGLVIFHNHEIVGAKMAREIADRLRFSKKEREKVVTLIRWHMFTVDEKITDAAVRRFIRRIGVENVKDMMDLRVGDRLGGGTQTAESWRLKFFKERLEKQLQPAPFSINDLAIDGNDIMKELGIKPGPQIGKMLQQLFEEVDEDLSKNTKEYLLDRVKKLA